VHSTPWVIQVAQRPPGISKPLPDAGMSAAIPPCHCHGLQRAGWVLQPWKRVEQRIVKKLTFPPPTRVAGSGSLKF